MNINQKVDYITEGNTKVLVFKKKNTSKGPASRDKLPFYNPTMELNRDFSILVAQWLINTTNKHLNFLDGLAASGIRGIRFASELVGDFDVKINDWSKESYKLIKKNIENISLQNIFPDNRDINALLSEEKFHYIDIDPFGTPIYFIDSVMRSIKNFGLVACTATDIAALCGVYPKVCLRRYGAQPLHSIIMHEVGLRILIGYLGKEAAKYDKGIEIISSYWIDHYFRIYIRIRNGVDYANKTISKIKTVNSNDFPFEFKNNVDIGPLWLGKLHNRKIIVELVSILFEKKIGTKIKLLNLLNLLFEEAESLPFFYTTDKLASELKILPPSMNYVFNKLKEQGFDINKTHFNPTGFKTNAPKEIIKKIFIN